MSSGTLYLHVGTHKTGTTAVQRYCAQNRKYLESLGISYPSFALDRKGGVGHHRVFYRMLNEKRHTEVSPIFDTWSRDPVLSEGGSMLLSAEPIWRLGIGSGTSKKRRQRFLERMASYLKEFNVTVVAAFRRPDLFAASMYQELVRQHHIHMPSLSVWARDPDRYSPGYYLLGEYYLNLTLLGREFGHPLVLDYGDLGVSGNIVPSFLSKLGVETFETEGLSRSNSGLPHIETAVKNYANQYISDFDHGVGYKFIDWMRSEDIYAEIVSHFPPDATLWDSLSDQENYVESRLADIAGVRRISGGNSLPSLDSFDNSDVGGEVNSVSHIPEPVVTMVDNYFMER